MTILSAAIHAAAAQDPAPFEDPFAAIDITGPWQCVGEFLFEGDIQITSQGESFIRRQDDGTYLSTGSGQSTTTLPDGRSERSAGTGKSQGILRGDKFLSTPVEVVSSERQFTENLYDGVVSTWRVSSQRMELVSVQGNPEILRAVGTCTRPAEDG